MTADEPQSTDARLCLDQFLKLRGIVATGGQAKFVIQDGQVKLNGVKETRRRRKLSPGDVVQFAGQSWTVESA